MRDRARRFEEVSRPIRRVERRPAGRGTPARLRTGAPRRRRTGRAGECRGRRSAARCRLGGTTARVAVGDGSVARSPAAGLADEPVQDPCGDQPPVLGCRTDVVDRRELAARTSAARSAVSGVGAREFERSLGRGRADRRGRNRPESQPDVAPTAATSPPSPPTERHHDLADRLGTARADLPEADLVAGRERDPDPEQQLVRSERGPPVRRPEDGRRRRRSPRADPTTKEASVASRTGSVSPAGDAFTTLPPIVPRFWIWAAPIVAAASTSAGRCSRQSADRRMSV